MMIQNFIFFLGCVVWLIFSIWISRKLRVSRMAWGLKKFRILLSIALSIIGIIIFLTNLF